MHGYCPLASGSKGNSFYIGTSNIKLLIDVGIGIRDLEERLSTLSVSLDEIDAVLITHEHSDHIRGLKALQRDIPVFANSDTAKGIVEAIGHQPFFKIFATGEPFHLGDLEIRPFSIPHDTLDPVAFVIRYGEWKLGVCADLGVPSATVRHHLQDLDYLYLEANHEEEMVALSRRPDYLKRRILGPTGHLSNRTCAKLLAEIWSPKLRQVHLAHLSEECNTSALALDTVREVLASEKKTTHLSVALQKEPSLPVSWQIPMNLSVHSL